jgi:hypothetical protein
MIILRTSYQVNTEDFATVRVFPELLEVLKVGSDRVVDTSTQEDLCQTFLVPEEWHTASNLQEAIKFC